MCVYCCIIRTYVLKNLKIKNREGYDYPIYFDPGAPPQFLNSENTINNQYVWNHCLVSIGDEKHCNRFLEKEECNYLGDSYNWVGA